MSNYIHVFPTGNKEVKKSFEDNGISFNGIADGRLPTQLEFDDIISKVEPYEYELRDDGSMSLRQGSIRDLFEIIHGIVDVCGPQITFSDSMNAIIVSHETDLESFKNSVLFD